MSQNITVKIKTGACGAVCLYWHLISNKSTI